MSKLIDAIQNINIQEVKRLLETGTDPSTNNNWAIKWVSYKGQLEIVELLIDYVNIDIDILIKLAQENNHIKIIR